MIDEFVKELTFGRFDICHAYPSTPTSGAVPAGKPGSSNKLRNWDTSLWQHKRPLPPAVRV